MKAYFLTLILTLVSMTVFAQGNHVEVKNSKSGVRLVVDGQDFIIKGMNWDYYPIGTNYEYILWNQPEDFIKSVLHDEMTMLKNMGVNALRIYEGIPKEWIAYIYENYGIYTMLNHPFGRYGLTIDSEWVVNTDYADPRVRTLLLEETTKLAEEYKDTPGLLLFLLGNENNYGLSWEDPEREKPPSRDKKSDLEARAMYKLFLLSDDSDSKDAVADNKEENLSLDQIAAIRAKSMYKLYNEAAKSMKSIDKKHPIALCNGDLMYIDVIKDECPDVDIFGTNMYRGISFGDTFKRVKLTLDKPIMFTEVGADAYNVIEQSEDQESQAYYLRDNWKEIFANVAGIGGAENSIGGFTFQFSDGWWKFGFSTNLDIHDKTASWYNGGYYRDERNGMFNMNEEWFGICAKTQPKGKEYTLAPRAAYFVLQQANEITPYDNKTTLVELERHFANIDLKKALKAAEEYLESLNDAN